MADLPDYYTQTAISEAEAASFKGGLDANKSATPVSRDIYYATDSKILRICVVDGTWININALYLLLAGGTMSGVIAMGTNKITGLGDPTLAQDAATRAYVLAQKALCLLLAGGAMTGEIAMGANKITGLADPTLAQDAATRAYVLAAAALRLALTGGTMAGNIIMGGNKLTGLGAGVAAGESVRYEQLITPTKEFFMPMYFADTFSRDGGRITASGDDVYIMLIVPQDFTAITNLEVILLPKETGADMHVRIDTFYGAYNGGEDWNVHTEVGAGRDIGATVTDQNLAHSISDLVDIAALVAGDLLVVYVSYDVTAIDSNAYVKGIRLRYT